MRAGLASAAIIGAGSFLPGQPVDRRRLLDFRADLPVDLFEEYFGVLARHYVIAPEDGSRLSICDEAGNDVPLTTTEMGAQAALAACRSAGVELDEIDALITNSTTPDDMLPPFTLKLQRRLGLKEVQLLDLRGGCSASIQALNAAVMLVETGRARSVLVVSSECTSPHYFAQLRSAPSPSFGAVVNGLLFADGASAVIVSRESLESNAAMSPLHIAYSSSRSCFASAPPGFTLQLDVDGDIRTKHDNRAIRRTLPRAVARGYQDLHTAGYPMDGFDVIVVPQVNKSMMTMVGEDLGTLDALNHCYYGHETGNVPAAAMFMALDFAWRRGRFDNAHSIGVLSIETTSWNYAVAALRLN